MNQKILKSAMFGFSKASVCEYIAKQEKEFAQKLQAKENEVEAKQRELTERIAQLEQENSRLRGVYEEIGALLAQALQEPAEEESL